MGSIPWSHFQNIYFTHTKCTVRVHLRCELAGLLFTNIKKRDLGRFSIPVLVSTWRPRELMSSAAAQVWIQSKVRIWPSRDQIPGCRLDPPPILLLYQVCSGDDFRRLLTAYRPECLSPHRSINMRSARLRSFPRIQAQLVRWQQQQHNFVGACIVAPFVWISPAPPLAPSINCSTPRPSSILQSPTNCFHHCWLYIRVIFSQF